MKFVRTHRSPLAWMLAGLILFGALVCSVGHGQMLHALMPAASAEVCGVDSHAVDGHATEQGDHGLLMQLALFDCAYASKLTSVLLSFTALAWWLRVLRHRALLPQRLAVTAARHDSPGRVAQAP